MRIFHYTKSHNYIKSQNRINTRGKAKLMLCRVPVAFALQTKHKTWRTSVDDAHPQGFSRLQVFIAASAPGLQLVTARDGCGQKDWVLL